MRQISDLKGGFQAAQVAVMGLVIALMGCQGSGGENQVDNPKISSIGYLKSLAQHSTTPITQDLTIEGVVVANDKFGEFHKTLIIQDNTAGIAILLDDRALADKYPFGALVRVYCNGLALGLPGGAAELGAMPQGDQYTVDRIAGSQIERYVRLVAADKGARPELLTINQACVARWVNCYVVIKEVRFMESGQWCETDMESGQSIDTERTIEQINNQQMVVRVAGDCVYATSPLPVGRGDVAGIVRYFGGRYSLCVSDRGLSNFGISILGDSTGS